MVFVRLGFYNTNCIAGNSKWKKMRSIGYPTKTLPALMLSSLLMQCLVSVV